MFIVNYILSIKHFEQLNGLMRETSEKCEIVDVGSGLKYILTGIF